MNIKRHLLTLAVAVGVVTTASAGSTNSSPNWGTDILHYFVHDHFTNSEAASNASAVVDLQFKSQGHAENQKFDLVAKRLAPGTTYTLLSLSAGETNYTDATQFITDANGNAKLKFKSHNNGNSAKPNNNGNGGGNGVGNGNQSLPEGLEPVIDLSTLTIVDVNTQVVAQAGLGSPDKLQYLVKRKLEGDSAAALLMIQGTLKKTRFSLKAVNLAPTNDYWLAINEVVVQTNRTDAKGGLKINSLTTPVGSPLDIQKVQLLDTSTNVVLSTELP